ncbi:MAG: ribbon-helix-helix protein, CopG family [Anaerosomatales bacterium]|nr:ribbon-helix-helix protein, CopG family [Anaerosomatales bacterium]MDT8434458.1 ribbon-helix-helix protein, CopG family [Anaerosomatales bacterium]
MGRMVRKQIVMDAEQERAVAARARALGISQSEFVRRALKLALTDDDSLKTEAWRQARELMDQAAVLRTGSGGRRWTREELHERPGRRRY